MGFLQRLLGQGASLCEGCEQQPATKQARLPNGQRLRLCEKCEAEIAKHLQNPVRPAEVELILDSIPVSGKGVWNIPWGATRDKILSSVSEQTAECLRRSGTGSILKYNTEICNRPVSITFILSQGRLDEVGLEFLQPTIDIRRPLRARHGESSMEFRTPGLAGQTDTTTIWKADGYQVEAIRTDNGGACISFQTPR